MQLGTLILLHLGKAKYQLGLLMKLSLWEDILQIMKHFSSILLKYLFLKTIAGDLIGQNCSRFVENWITRGRDRNKKERRINV